MSHFQAIVFDLGNVVFEINFQNCFDVWASDLDIPRERVAQSFAFDEAYAQHERGKLTAHQYWQHLRNVIHPNLTFENFTNGWNSIFGPPILPTMEFIMQEETLRLIALTNSNELHREFWQQKYNEELNHFDRVFCSSQMGVRKPDEAIFKAILAQCRIAAERIIFLDDLLPNINGAKKVGIKGILFDQPSLSISQLRNLLND